MGKQISKKKLIKTIIICAVFAALLAGLIYLMVSDQNYGKPDKLDIGSQNFGQRLWIGIQVAFLGLATVFLMLVLLIFAITLIRYMLQGFSSLAKKRAEQKAAENIQAPTVAVSEDICEDDEIVAAITAAIMAYYETEEVSYKSNLKFRVRSIKEI